MSEDVVNLIYFHIDYRVASQPQGHLDHVVTLQITGKNELHQNETRLELTEMLVRCWSMSVTRRQSFEKFIMSVIICQTL